jgi:hypothetical protein
MTAVNQSIILAIYCHLLMKPVHQCVYKSASFHVYTVYGLASAKSFSYQINQEAVQNRREQEQIKEVDLGAERVVPLDRPEAVADEPLGRGDAPEHVDEHSDGVVGDVRGVHPPGVGDDDAAARALVEVDVVDGGGRADDAAKGGDGVEERGGQVDGAGAPDDRGARGFEHGGGEEDRERLARGQEVEDAEPLAQRCGEGRVHALEEENGRGLAGRFGCSCGGGCHCRDKDFF